MILDTQEHATLDKLIENAISNELCKEKPNFTTVAYYINLKLKINLLTKSIWLNQH